MLFKWSKLSWQRSAVTIALLVLTLLAAINPGSLRAEIEYEWAGFGSIGAGLLDDDSINEANIVPHNLYDEDLQFDVDSRLGFQGTAFFNDSLSATVQVVADSAEDDVELEWGYLTYDVSQRVKVRAGRLRRPLYGLSDVLQVGYVYPWARLPPEVYTRDVQLYDEINGLDVLIQSSINDWDVTTEIYYGESSDEVEEENGEKGEFTTNGSYGIAVEFEKDWLSLRFGYHRASEIDVEPSSDQLSLENGLQMAGFGSIANDMATDELDGEFFSLSTGIDYENWLFNAEYIRVPVENGLAPEENSWYVMGGRRFGPWTLHLTYAERERDSDLDLSQPIRELAANPFLPAQQAAQLLALAGGVDTAIDSLISEQHSYTLGLRYDFEQPISIKTEYQRIEDDQFDLTSNLFSVVVDFLF